MAKHADISDLWRVFSVEYEVEGWGTPRWLRDGTTTLKPGESMQVRCTELAKECKVKRVRLIGTVAS